MQTLVSIREVSNRFGISTRTLRHYEAEGLLQGRHQEGSAHRWYAPEDLARLHTILLLRRLRLPLAEIRALLDNPNNNEVFGALRGTMAALAAERASLEAAESALAQLLQRLQQRSGAASHNFGRVDAQFHQLVAALPPAGRLQQTGTAPEPGEYRPGDVRIVYLPPATVAAAHQVGGEAPEEATREMLRAFIGETGLAHSYPALRSYGFNHPNGTRPDGSDHGYERWVTIPPDMEVPKPLTKKQFDGGLYAARAIPFGQFEEWDRLLAWAEGSEQYAPRLTTGQTMSGLLDEVLDFMHTWNLNAERHYTGLQLDLLLPVRRL